MYHKDKKYSEGANQGLAAGLLIMGGIGACDHDQVVAGLLISLFGVLIYLDAKGII